VAQRIYIYQVHSKKKTYQAGLAPTRLLQSG